MRERRGEVPPRAHLPAGLSREIRHLLERRDEFRTAVRVTRIIDRVDADEYVRAFQHLRPRHRERKENSVARGDVRYRNPAADFFDRLMFRNRQVRSQRASSKHAEVDLRDAMLSGMEERRHAARREKLDQVALPVVERERITIEPIAASD